MSARAMSGTQRCWRLGRVDPALCRVLVAPMLAVLEELSVRPCCGSIQ